MYSCSNFNIFYRFCFCNTLAFVHFHTGQSLFGSAYRSPDDQSRVGGFHHRAPPGLLTRWYGPLSYKWLTAYKCHPDLNCFSIWITSVISWHHHQGKKMIQIHCEIYKQSYNMLRRDEEVLHIPHGNAASLCSNYGVKTRRHFASSLPVKWLWKVD